MVEKVEGLGQEVETQAEVEKDVEKTPEKDAQACQKEKERASE